MASAPARGLTKPPQLHNCPTYYDEVDSAAAHCHRSLAGPRHRTPRPSIAVPRRAWHAHSHRCGTGSARTPQCHADTASQAGADARGTAEQDSEEAAWTVTASLLPVDKVLQRVRTWRGHPAMRRSKAPHEWDAVTQECAMSLSFVGRGRCPAALPRRAGPQTCSNAGI